MWLPEGHAFGGQSASVLSPRSDRLSSWQFSRQDRQAEGPLELGLPIWRRPGRAEPTVGTGMECGADCGHCLGVLVSWPKRQVSPSIGEPTVGHLGSSGGQPAH